MELFEFGSNHVERGFDLLHRGVNGFEDGAVVVQADGERLAEELCVASLPAATEQVFRCAGMWGAAQKALLGLLVRYPGVHCKH